MLTSVTLDDQAGVPVTFHETVKRYITGASGLAGISPVRDLVRPRPQQHGGIDDSRYTDHSTIILEGECFSTLSIGDAFTEFHAICAPMIATLDGAPALLKWQEGVPGVPAVPAQTKFVDALLALTPSLYWRHGETVGSTANDASGNGRTGTYVSGITINQTGLVGDGDKAISGDGTANAKVTSTYNPFTGNITVGGWANATTLAAARNVFGGSAGVGPLLQIQTNGDVVWWSDLGAASQTWATVWTAATPIFWVLTWNNTTKISELFLNAVSKGTKTSANVFNAAPGNFTLAGSGAASGFLGPMDETFVIPGILTPAQISDLYADGPNAITTAGVPAVIGGLALQKLVKLASDVDPVLSESEPCLKWQAHFRAQDPRAYSQTLTTVNGATLSTASGGLLFPAIWNWLFNPSSGGLCVVTNPGNRRTPPVFRIYGGCSNPVIVRQSTQARFTLIGTIQNGDYLEIDIAKRTIKLNGTSNATFMLDAAHSDWSAMELPVGTETFQLIASTNDSTAYLSTMFRAAYA